MNNIDIIKIKENDVEVTKYLINGVEVTYEEWETVQEECVKIDRLRRIRSGVLKAFDIYKSNVAYGVIEDTNREAIISWYNACLDLDDDAINNPPEEIKRYLG